MSKETGAWRVVAQLNALDPDYPAGVTVDGLEIALHRVGDEVYATSNICSHAFALLSDGEIEGFEVFCPLHGGGFDVRTGEAKSPPCVEKINVYRVRLEGQSVSINIGGDHNE